MKYKLKALKKVELPYRTYEKGDVFNFETWNYDHPLSKKGYLVECCGHGCFGAVKPNEDVEIVEKEKKVTNTPIDKIMKEK